MEEHKGTERNGCAISPASSLPRACLCLCLAQRGVWHSTVLGGWSQPCTADQGLQSHFFINYF